MGGGQGDDVRTLQRFRGKPSGEGFCPSCNKHVRAFIEDDGIGPYEYWGAKGVHHNYQPHCEICDEIVDDYEEHEPDYDELYEREFERRHGM